MPRRGRRRQVKVHPEVEDIIQDYIVQVHQKWHSNVFPSSQLAKVALRALNKPRSYYRNFHMMVKQILKKWEKQNICQNIESSIEASQKNKKIFYKFPDNTIRQFQIEQVIPLPF